MLDPQHDRALERDQPAHLLGERGERLPQIDHQCDDPRQVAEHLNPRRALRCLLVERDVVERELRDRLLDERLLVRRGCRRRHHRRHTQHAPLRPQRHDHAVGMLVAEERRRLLPTPRPDPRLAQREPGVALVGGDRAEVAQRRARLADRRDLGGRPVLRQPRQVDRDQGLQLVHGHRELAQQPVQVHGRLHRVPDLRQTRQLGDAPPLQSRELRRLQPQRDQLREAAHQLHAGPLPDDAERRADHQRTARGVRGAHRRNDERGHSLACEPPRDRRFAARTEDERRRPIARQGRRRQQRRAPRPRDLRLADRIRPPRLLASLASLAGARVHVGDHPRSKLAVARRDHRHRQRAELTGRELQPVRHRLLGIGDRAHRLADRVQERLPPGAPDRGAVQRQVIERRAELTPEQHQQAALGLAPLAAVASVHREHAQRLTLRGQRHDGVSAQCCRDAGFHFGLGRLELREDGNAAMDDLQQEVVRCRRGRFGIRLRRDEHRQPCVLLGREQRLHPARLQQPPDEPQRPLEGRLILDRLAQRERRRVHDREVPVALLELARLGRDLLFEVRAPPPQLLVGRRQLVLR